MFNAFIKIFIVGMLTSLFLTACSQSDGYSTSGKVVLSSIQIQRADAYEGFNTTEAKTLIQGTHTQAKAIGIYSDGSQKDITTEVTWSENGSKIDVDNTGLIFAHTPGAADVLATLSDVVAKVSGTVVAATLESVQVFGNNVSPLGRTIQLEAIATFDVGISADVTNDAVWTSTDPAVTVINGEVNSSTKGASDITATFEDANTPPVSITSAVHVVDFIDAEIDHLEILKNGSSACTGEAINGIKQTLELVDKVSYPTDPDGLSPNAFYPLVCAVYTDGIKVYVNQDAIWWSDDQQVAQVNSLKGSFVFGTDIGTDVTISAKYAGLEASFPVDVVAKSGKTLDSIFITNSWNGGVNPITALTIEVEDETPLVAYGNYTYSDGSTGVEYINANVSWQSADLSTVWIWDVMNSYIRGIQVSGSPVAVTATWQGKSASVNVTVNLTSAYNSIEIQKSYVTDGQGEVLNAANPLVISQGQVQYITAWGVKADDVRVYINTEVAWSSDDNSIASMDFAQRDSDVTGVAAGDTNVTAVGGGYTGTAPVVVVPHDGILEANIRWEKEGSLSGLPGTSVTGKTAVLGHIPVLDPSTAIWYFVRAGQGYTKDTTIDKINLSFLATLDGGTAGVHLNVFMYDASGNKVKADILNDADWTAYQAAHPTYVIRTDYYEKSEGKIVQCNFILRLGDSKYTGRNKDFTIDKFVVTTTP